MGTEPQNRFIKLHRALNTLLSIIAFSLGLYLVGLPIIPELKLRAYSLSDTVGITGIQEMLFPTNTYDVLVSGKRLIVPSILINGEVLEGEDTRLLNEGIWHRPDTSAPDQGGNSVFVAHRFQYTSGPNTFYHLDKVSVGDEILIDWNGKRYVYHVYEKVIVTPQDTHIEANTTESIVTLYTCTPLWTAEKRLVVRAKLLSV